MSQQRIGAIAIALCLAVFAVAAWRIHLRRSQAVIDGHILYAPKGWRVFTEMSTEGDTTFIQTRHNDVLPATIGVVNRRNHPDDVSHFVSGWKAAVGSKGFRPLSVDEFKDPITAKANMQCVSIRWKSPQPLMIYCTTSGGHWRLVLMGNNSAIDGVDGLATQMKSLEAIQ